MNKFQFLVCSHFINQRSQFYLPCFCPDLEKLSTGKDQAVHQKRRAKTCLCSEIAFAQHLVALNQQAIASVE